MPMEAKEIFEAESQSVRKLLTETGVGFYIPPYQRPYSWAKDKVSRLLEDSMNGFRKLVLNDESFTFLGTIITIHDRDFVTIQPIVKTDVPAKVLNVIDGQQRLISLILICIGLHNRIRLMHAKLLKPYKGSAPGSPDPVAWLDGQTLQVLEALKGTFINMQSYGTAPKYPRMIRAFVDQWSRDKANAKYLSPLAYLISQYSDQTDGDKPTEFKMVARAGHFEGEEAVVSRYSQIVKAMKNVYDGRMDEVEEEFPLFKEIIGSKQFQKALLNHEFPAEVVDILHQDTATPEFKGVLRLVLFASYVLDRVALTVVKGKNEDYAFSVFESLNTTGEPLTAFETFRPRVVSAEGLGSYENSDSRQLIEEVADYLSRFKPGEPLQNATRDLLVSFSSAETGERISKRLSDQRRYLRDEYLRYEKDDIERVAFVRHLRDMAIFLQYAWVGKDDQPTLHGLPIQASSDTVKLCLGFLTEANHTITIGPLVRFFSQALGASTHDQAQKIQDFEQAIKAITAFSVLWRASRRGTANIDQEYRDLMTGHNSVTGLAPLARSPQSRNTGSGVSTDVDVAALKAELRERLKSVHHGAIADKNVWIRDALTVPAYTNSKQVTRFVLLAAYHDSIEDASRPGLIIPGKPGVSPCLTFDGWRDERHLSLEHIGPQDGSNGWHPDLYSDREIVHRLGNLVLVPKDANSSLGNRPWQEKRVLFAALGAKSKHDAQNVLDTAEQAGLTFAKSTQELVELSKYMPHLAAIGYVASDWTVSSIEDRSKCILDRSWERLYNWLM